MKQSIMIVDDDPVIISLMTECLEGQNYQILSYQTARECIDNLFAVKPDILITDLQLPDLSGIELIRFVHAEKRDHTPKIILTSANKNSPTLCFTEKVEPDYFLTKPFQMEDLLAAVDYLLQSG